MPMGKKKNLAPGAAAKSAAVRVLVADDDALTREAVAAMLKDQGRIEIVGEAADGDQAIQRARGLMPDILLLDLNMPRKPGMDALRDMGQSVPGMRTLVLTVSIEARQVLEALQLGARGILKKENARQHLQTAIRAVLAGQFWLNDEPLADVKEVIHELSEKVEKERAKANPKLEMLNPKEVQIVNYIVEGRTNKDIAETMVTSEQVVKNHLGKIFDKLGVFNRLELALYALDNHLVDRKTN